MAKNVQKTNRTPASYPELFWLFAKIGLVTVGGGAVMLPLIQNAVVEQKKWFDENEFADAVALCNSAPGAFTVNASIYIGYKERGLSGAIAGMLGMVTPSIVIILILAYMILLGSNVDFLQQFFWGVRPIVAALLLDAALKLRKMMIKSRFDVLLAAFGLALLLLAGLNTVFVILAGVIISIMYRRTSLDKAAKAAAGNNSDISKGGDA